jgi:hypothetical protein
MDVTAAARAKTTLRATTTLEPAAALAVVKRAAGAVKGGGASLLTSGVVNLGAEVHIEREQPDGLALSITSGKRLVELCTFSASVEVDDGHTCLRVGGLQTYKTSQPRMFGFIPSGPKSILGFSPYKRFLDQLGAELHAQDSHAEILIGVPSQS